LLGGPNDANLRVCEELDPLRDMLELQAHEMGMNVDRAYPRPNSFGFPCYAARPYHLIIGANGNLMKCTVVLDRDERNVVGRLDEDGSTVMDIDRLTRWCAPYFSDDPLCRKCFFLPRCAGASCPMRRALNGQRHCAPEKVRIGPVLQKMWTGNRAAANRFDLRREKLIRARDYSGSVEVTR
jgi:uncharacterized protein